MVPLPWKLRLPQWKITPSTLLIEGSVKRVTARSSTVKKGGLLPEEKFSTNNKLSYYEKKEKCVNRILPSDILLYVWCKCTVAVLSTLRLY